MLQLKRRFRRKTKMAEGVFEEIVWKCVLRLTAVVMFALAAGCGSRSHPAAQQKQSTPAGAASSASQASNSNMERDDDKPYTIVEARHVVFHERSGIRLRTEWLQGRLYPTHKGLPPSLDDPKSFKVEVEQGKTEISLDDLSAVLRDGAFKDSRLGGIHIKAHGENQIEITGTLREVVPLPVQLVGDIAVTSDGRLSLHIDHLKLFKIPFKGMLDLMRLKPASLLHGPAKSGMEVHGDSLYLRTDELLPPPRKTGLLTSVHCTPDGQLEEDYGHEQKAKPSLVDWDQKRWRNYLRLTGGTVRFGKLTMQSADLTLLDTSPGDWFQFDLAHYREQLVSGDMRMTPSGGLRLFVPDITRVHSAKNVPAPAR